MTKLEPTEPICDVCHGEIFNFFYELKENNQCVHLGCAPKTAEKKMVYLHWDEETLKNQKKKAEKLRETILLQWSQQKLNFYYQTGKKKAKI